MSRYVDRDASGNVISTYCRPQREGHEYIDDNSYDNWTSAEYDKEQAISALENKVTKRYLRGAALGDLFSIGKIQGIEDQIALLR